MSLADAHIHLFADGYPGQYGALFPHGGEVRIYEAMRAVHGIQRALVVGYEGDPWAAGNNEYIARLARDRSWIAPLAFCHAHAAPSAAQLEKLWDAGFYGIALYLAADGATEQVLSWPEETLAALNARRAVLSLNVPLAQIAPLRPFLQRLPEATILASHLGLPGRIATPLTDTSARELATPLLAQADLPHFGIKLSGFYACNAFPHAGLAPLLSTLHGAFGAERLYWGSDFVPALDSVSFAQTIEAARPTLADATATDATAADATAADAALQAIFGENLIRALDRVR